MGFLQISLSLHTWVAAETHLADDKNNNNNNINNNNKWQYKRGHHQGQGYKVKSLTHNPKDEGSIFLLNIRKQSHSATIEKGLVPQYKNRFLTNVFQICVIFQHFCLGNEHRNSLSHAKGPVQAAVPLPLCLSFVEHLWNTYASPKISPWPHQVLPAQSQAVIADLQTTQTNAGLGWSRRSPPEYRRWSQLCSVSNTVQLSKCIFIHRHSHYWRII